MQPLFSKSILPFFKKHTTFLKRGRMVVFELLLNRCWKQCIHPKIDTVVLKKHWTFLKKRLTFPKKHWTFFLKQRYVSRPVLEMLLKQRLNGVLMVF